MVRPVGEVREVPGRHDADGPEGGDGVIINIFPFFDELDLLEIRLHELAGIVNRFVLVESTKTFTYRDKPLYYAENRERYRQWWPQIDHYVIDNMSPSGDCWGRERQQRNHLMYGLIGQTARTGFCSTMPTRY